MTSQKLIRMAHMLFMLARHLGYYIFYTYALLNCTIAYSYASYYSHSQHATLHISNINPLIHFNFTYRWHTHYYYVLSKRPKANNYTHCRLLLQGWVHVPGVRRDKDCAGAPVFKPAEERKWLFTHDRFCKKWYSFGNECESIIEAPM